MKKEQLILDSKGGFSISTWQIGRKKYQAVGAKSVGYKALDTIDTIQDSDGNYFKILRHKLVGKKAIEIDSFN